MAKGSRYDLRRQLRIWESVIPLSRRGYERPERTKGAYQHGDPGIIPVMRRKRSHVSSVN